jgi:alanine dehydrogenase
MPELPPLLYLSARDVRQALPMGEAIAAAKEAFLQVSTGRAVVPARTTLRTSRGDGCFLLMPCESLADGQVSLKMIGLFEGNPRRGLPLIHALVILADAASGVPLAVMDGAALTAIRTGAASGAATDALARPEASTAAVFGAVVEGRTQLEAVCAVRPIRRAFVFDPRRDAADGFAREMSVTLGIAVEVAADPAGALRGADIICTATTSRTRVFDDALLAAGAHINAVGSYQPDVAEIPVETVRRARIFVDERGAAREEAGDLIGPLAGGRIEPGHIIGELGGVLAGRTEGRRRPEEVTLFKSVGLAIQDLCAASRAARRALEQGLGISLPR